MLKILLIEDLVEPAVEMISLLQELGYTVTWIQGATDQFQDENAAIVLEVIPAECDGSTAALSEFDVALVDYELLGNFSGEELIPLLIKSEVVCIGISDDASLNREMMRMGAKYSVPKHALCQALSNGSVNIDDLAWGEYSLKEIEELTKGSGRGKKKR